MADRGGSAKAQVCGRSLAGIAGSNAADGMDLFCVDLRTSSGYFPIQH